ncbi:uncharacterized protein LOC129923591 isoform X1 [Biomphalaria glabrata]|uniref:Uncharacterized protein LOC129923591 isoform X1 n=2 Tax=Biomphalaria glabrata TaxID=6526 RepID=A0A9W2Z8E9_BIOGL|nr:uncharacterized protein LOC129923591 isoform X1 [Biomphalaria glabrata]
MWDVHNTCLAVAIMSVLLSCAVIWSSLTAQDSPLTRQEKEVMRMLSEMNQTISGVDKGGQSKDVLQFVSSTLPWLAKLDALGNYFTGGNFLGANKYHQKYTHGVLSILTHFQDLGGIFADCLQDVGFDHRQAVSPEMTYENRFLWDRSRDGIYRHKHKFKLHYGTAAFFSCDALGVASDKKCGHVLLMQDPIRMAMAQYGSCHVELRDDPWCRLARSPGVSVEEWIIARGNPVFKSLVYNPILCLHSKASCEENLHTFLANLTSTNNTNLVSYIIGNLDSWFSMVGLHEHLADSLAMLHHVTRLPLHQCHQLSHLASSVPRQKPLASSRHSKLPSLPSLVENSQSDVSFLVELSVAENKLISSLPALELQQSANSESDRDRTLPDVDVVDFDVWEANHQKNTSTGASIIVDNYSDVDMLQNEDNFKDLNLNDTGISDDYEDYDNDEDESQEKLREVMEDHQLTSDTRRYLETNRQKENLYITLSRNQKVLNALSLDLNLYEAVKRLYSIQSRIFFNSIHH